MFGARIVARPDRRLRRGTGGQPGLAADDDDLAREPVRRSTPPAPASSSIEVLDPDAGLALEVDPGLDGEHGRRRQRAVERRAPSDGSSWVARPIPWPRPWPNCRPVAAASMTARASRSSVAARRAAASSPSTAASIWRDRRGLGRGDQLVDGEVARRPARRRTASGSCRSGSRRPGRRSRTGATWPGCDRPLGRRPVRQGRLRARRGRSGRRRAPRRRRSGSATRGRGRVAARSRPAGSSGSSAASARSATAQAAATRSSSAGSLIARSASIQPSTGTSSTSGAAAASRAPDGVRHETRPRRRPAARRSTRRAPASAWARSRVAVDDPRLGRLPLGLDRVARVGEQDDLVAAHEELARGPGDLLLAVGEDEPGQVAHVLAAHPEVGVDPGLARTGPGGGRAGQGGRPRSASVQRARSAGVGGAGEVGRLGRRRGRRRRRSRSFGAYFFRFAWCSLQVFAKARVSSTVVLGEEVEVAVLRVGVERRIDRGDRRRADRAGRQARRGCRCCSRRARPAARPSRSRLAERRPERVRLPVGDVELRRAPACR